jgi:hypothetical protein
MEADTTAMIAGPYTSAATTVPRAANPPMTPPAMVPALKAALWAKSVLFTNDGEAVFDDENVPDDVDEEVEDEVKVCVDESELSSEGRIDEVG